MLNFALSSNIGRFKYRFSFVEAATVSPYGLIPAYSALFGRGCLQSGQTVLNHVGAGGVGHVAIQLAKLGGATVLTTVSTPNKADFVKRLGANQVIFYQDQNVVEAVKDFTEGKGADLILDTVGAGVLTESVEIINYFGFLMTLLDLGLVINFQEARLRNFH